MMRDCCSQRARARPISAHTHHIERRWGIEQFAHPDTCVIVSYKAAHPGGHSQQINSQGACRAACIYENFVDAGDQRLWTFSRFYICI